MKCDTLALDGASVDGILHLFNQVHARKSIYEGREGYMYENRHKELFIIYLDGEVVRVGD